MFKKIITLSACLLACNLQAEWDPEYALTDIDQEAIDSINDYKFSSLKQKIVNYNKNSWCSEEKTRLLMDLVYITKPMVCVEIGAFTGSSVLPVAATLKLLNDGTVYAIDAWSNSAAVRFLDDQDANKAWWSSVDMKSVFDTFMTTIKTWNVTNKVSIIKSPSEAAVELVDDIDFLHLDGDYSEEVSLHDVELYLPKVKVGGYILLSNLFTMVKTKQPKLKSFLALFESCELVCEIEKDNAILFRKN